MALGDLPPEAPAPDPELFASAAALTQHRPELAAALAEFGADGSEADVLEELRDAIQQNAARVVADARGELLRLQEAERQLAATQANALRRAGAGSSRAAPPASEQDAAAEADEVAADRAVIEARQLVEATRRDVVLALVEKGMLPFARIWLRDKLDDVKQRRFRAVLDLPMPPGLSELANPEHDVPTEAFARVARLLRELPGGSIGISGPRGAGKSTLVDAFCGGRPVPYEAPQPTLPVAVAAPVEYAPVDFLLGLFAGVCAAFAPAGPTALPDRPPLLSPGVSWYRPAVVTAGVAAAVVGAVAAVGLAPDGVSQQTQRLIAGFSLLAAAAVFVRLGVRSGRIEAVRELPTAAAIAVAAGGAVAVGFGGFGSTSHVVPLHPVLAGAFLVVAAALAAGTADLPSWAYDHPAHPPGVLRQVTAALVPPLALVAFAGGVALLALAWAGTAVSLRFAVAVLAAAGGAVAVLVAQQLKLRERSEVRLGDAADVVETEARRWLRTIRYQQSFSSGWGGSVGVKAPLGIPLEAGAELSGGSELSERPLTFPELVGGFRAFVQLATSRGPAYIGIDELDKMPNDGSATRFLNAIKGIFGLRRCFFLVTVSEEAAADFDRRGLPFRDVFDSSFDEIVHVGYLDLRQSQELLARRVIGLPVAFAALCHCFAGGLPRDLIRFTRTLFQLRDDGGPDDLPTLARALAEREFLRRRDATVVAMRPKTASPAVAAAARWLGGLDTSGLDATALAWLLGDASLQALPTPAADDAAAFRAFEEFVGYWYFCATVAEIFRDIDVRTLKAAEEPDAPAGFDALARARQDLAIDARLSWERVSAFRDAWGLAPVEPRGQEEAAASPNSA